MGLCVRRFTGETLIEGISPFNLASTLECGQAFRWERHGYGYVGVVRGRAFLVRQVGEGLGILGDAPDLIDLAIDYFDLERDYDSIEDALRGTDQFLARAVNFGSGLRILRQEPWECLISFIISAHNRIPFIRRAVEALAAKFGERAKFSGRVGFGESAELNERAEFGEHAGSNGRAEFGQGICLPDLFSFPGPIALAGASLDDLAACHTGFRAPYIQEAAKRIASGELDLDELRNLDTASARSRLMGLRGVGDKVADCVLLFSLGKSDVFPMDIWIARVMHDVYLRGQDVPKSRFLRTVREFAAQRFGELQGYAQEYLYHYARNLKLDRGEASWSAFMASHCS